MFQKEQVVSFSALKGLLCLGFSFAYQMSLEWSTEAWPELIWLLIDILVRQSRKTGCQNIHQQGRGNSPGCTTNTGKQRQRCLLADARTPKPKHSSDHFSRTHRLFVAIKFPLLKLDFYNTTGGVQFVTDSCFISASLF